MASDLNRKYLRLYKFIKLETFLTDLKLGGLKATLPLESVNIMEFLPELPLYHDMDEEHYTKALISFAFEGHSPAMWGIYADRGKEICLVFDFPIGEKSGKRGEFNIQGLHGRFSLSEVTYKHSRAKNVNDQDFYIRKSQHWEYEHEVRYVAEISEFKCVAASVGCFESTKLSRVLIWEEALAYLSGIIAGPKFGHETAMLESCIRSAYLDVKYAAELWNKAHRDEGLILCGSREADGLKPYRFFVTKGTFSQKYYRIMFEPCSLHEGLLMFGTKGDGLPNTEAEEHAIENQCRKEATPMIPSLGAHTLGYMYFSMESFNQMMKTWSLKACSAYRVNDPLEAMPYCAEIPLTRAILQHMQEQTPPFFCFSRCISNDVMWGSYGGRGSGICLAFLFPTYPIADYPGAYQLHPGNKDIFEALQVVRYARSRPEFTGLQHKLTKKESEKLALDLIATKGTDWAYEKEIRIMRRMRDATKQIDDGLLFSWPMKYLVGAVLGPHCPYSVKLIKRRLEIRYQEAVRGGGCSRAEALSPEFIVSRAEYSPKKYSLEAKYFADDDRMSEGKKRKIFLK